MVALATLTAAADQACATSLLAALPNQAEVTRIGAEALVAWAHQLYAGPGYWNPLRPDLLAEQRLADTAQLALFATATAQLATGKGWEARLYTQLLAELTRGAPEPACRAGGARRATRRSASPDRQAGGRRDGGHAGLAELASLALQLAPQIDLATGLADQMPKHSVQLAALSATLTSQQVIKYRTGAPDADPDAANRLAGSLTNLSVRLARLGQLEQALTAIEAVTIRRELARVRPGTFQPDLATSLNSLCAILSDLGWPEEALTAIEEATGIYLPGAGPSPPGHFRSDVARSLNSLSIVLSDLGRREEALTANQEAVTIRRELARARPDRLARSLANRSGILGDLGHPEEALTAIEEATGIYRELARARPDAFWSELAAALNLSTVLADLGRLEEALIAVEEATGIYRELARARPDAFRPDLAAALNTLAWLLHRLGRLEDALTAVQEAITIRRELGRTSANASRPDLARSLTNLSGILGDLGRRETR